MKKKENMEVESDLAFFENAMRGVRRLTDRAEPPPKPKPRVEPARPPYRTEDDEETLTKLEDIVAGRAVLDFMFSDEFVEGRASDCSKLDLARLRAGEFPPEAHVDLHGMNREAAREVLEDFFVECLRKQRRAALVVVGRGLRSPGGKPVLKELVVRWLAAGRLSRFAMAFASARPHDGGVGALYVLLRRRER